MARFLEDYKPTKKKKKETPKPQKVTQSPSVTKVNNKASNSTFMGGGSSVKKVEQRQSAAPKRQTTTTTPKRTTMTDAQYQKTYGEPRRATAQRTSIAKPEPVRRTTNHRLTAAQTQKMYGTTNPKLQTAEESRREREERRKEREERRLAAQRQKSGLNDQPTAAQKAATDRALKNTLPIAKESAKGAVYGHLTTLNDIASIKSQGNGKSREEIYDPNLAEKSRRQAEKRVKKLQAKTQETEDAIQKLTKNAKGLEKAYYGAVESGTGMLTDVGIGALTGTGQAGSLAAMYSRTYGSTRGKAQKEGATQAEDRAYAAAQAAKEVGTELMFPGAGLARGYAGKQGLKLADTAANILTKNLRGKAADLGGAGVRLIGGVLEENAEEVAGWGLDPLIKEITYGKKARTRNAQQAIKERSNALRAEIQNEDDARAAAAYLSSDDFFEQTVNAYREAGLSKKDAEEVADRMRDYLTASLTGDTDSMEQIEDEVSKKVAGSKKLEWDFDELKDTIASTTLLTAATGLPGTGMTAVKGAALRDQLGDDGVRALANTAIDFEDGEMSLKAKAMKARLDSGNELTSTQVYDLQVGMQEQIRKDTQREESSRRMADKRIKSDNLLTPYRQNENGGIDLDEATEASYREHVSRAKDIIDGLTSETKESLTANEKVDGSKAIAGFQTGVFTIEDANTLNYSNTTVRAAFEEATGVDLGQYVVKNKDGSVNIPATNTKTKDALFAMAADNLVKSAQAETQNWMDNAKGQVVTQVSARMGASGSAVLQQALDDVDERDRSKYMMTANAADMMYQAARNMGTEWSDVASEATKMFPGIDPKKLEQMYNAGLQDRRIANSDAHGRQVKKGQALSEMGDKETATGKVFIDTEVPLKGSVIRTFTEIAKNLGADIHFVDYIYDSENNPIAGANGSYDPNTNTFYLNVATGAETNIGYIFMHETTHYLKRFAPEQYQALENLVRERWFAFNPSQMQDAIARKIEAYKRVTKGQQVLTEEQALEEIIADASHDFINDPEFAKQVAEEGMGLAKAVLDSIRNALRMLRRIFASGSIDDDTHMNSLFRELDIMTEAEKLWLDAYKVAVQNSAAAAVDNWQGKANQGSVAEPIEEKQSFSISEPVERVKDLIAVHNLKPDDIRNTFELGGFPMPSIAITKDSMGHDQYGDITLMFHSDTIDPEFFRSNQVFGGDAWTPTFPSIAKKVSRKIADKVDKRLREILGLGQYDYTLGDLRLPALDDDNLTNALRYNEPYEAFKNDEVFQIAYLKNAKNFDVAVPTKEGRIRNLDKQALEYLDDKLPELTYNDIYDTVDHTMEYEPAVRQARKDYYESKGGVKLKALAKVLDEKMGYSDVIARLEATIKFRENGIPEVTDQEALRSILNEKVDQEGYKAWIDDLFDGIIEKTGIRNDKDMFTSSGKRRSWESLHDPVTLENVVKVMRTELAAGGTGIFGSNPKGAAQKQYKSLDEIRADEDRLQKLSEEEYKAQSEAAVGKMSEVCIAIAEHNPKRFSNKFGAALDVGSDIAEILNGTRNRNTIQRKLKKDYLLDVTDDQMDDLMEAIDAIANLPTGYFEAKPRRAVGFDEVKAAVIPANTEASIKEGLSKRGITTYEYDPELEGDRTSKVNDAATEQDLRFSISENSSGESLTEWQQEYFRNSKIVDADGRLKVMYHGTPNMGFTVFDLKKAKPGTLGRGFYFTDSKTHAGNHGQQMEVYLNIENPLQPDTYDITKEQLRQFVAALAEDEDYGIDNYGYDATVDSVTDSVWGRSDFQMLHDLNLTCVGDLAEACRLFNYVNGTNYDGIVTAVETLAMRPEQIKLTDNLAPTSDPDIRFSVSDDEYLSAVEKYQQMYDANEWGWLQAEDEIQRMVDQAAVEAGYATKAYHGTDAEFNVFKREYIAHGRLYGDGFYFSPLEEIAGSYGSNVKPYFLKTGVLTERELMSDYLAAQDYKDFADKDDAIAFSREKRQQFEKYGQGIERFRPDVDIVQGMYRVIYTTVGAFQNGYIMVATEPEYIKSAEPIVKDDNGNVIPLSKRFNDNSVDTRFSISATDSQGNRLTEEQRQYFGNSQARDEQGRLVPVYHTTNYGGFTIFDPSYSDDKRSLFFASNWNVSQTYGRNADRKYRFEEYSFKSLNDFAKAYAENFSNNLNDPENDILEQVVNALRIHIEKNSMPAFDLGDTMFERVKNYMKIAEAGDVRADKYRIEMKGAYGGMVRASSYDELLGKLSRQMSNNSSKSGYYECYLNLENPLIVDAQNQSWNNIPYGEYSEDAVLAIKNLTVQDMGDGIYVNIWGDRKVDGKWQEFRESDTIEFEYLTVDGEYEIPERAWDEVYDFLVKQGLSSDYAYEHSDAFFDFNGLDTFDKDGRKVESDVRRYRTRELAALADAKGYDSVIIRNCYDIGAASHLKGEGLSDIYIAFSSNQVKDINNENPTENPDIRYSFTDDEEAMCHMAHDYAYDNSYEALAYYESLIDTDTFTEVTFEEAQRYIDKDIDEFYAGLTRYADGMKFDDPVLEEGRVRMARSKQDYFNSNIAKWNEAWLTDGEVLDVKSVKKQVRDLVTAIMQESDTTRKYRTDLVNKAVIDMRLAYFYAKKGRTDVADALLWHSAHRMIDGVEFYADDSTYEEYKGLRDYLKKTRIQLGEEYWSDADYGAFRKANFGRINLVQGSTNVDQIYAELEEIFPGLFDSEEYTTPPDQLMHIAEVLDSIQPYKEAYSSEQAAEFATDIASDLLEIMQNGKELQSVADKYKNRYEAKAKAMKARHAEAMLKVRQQREKGIKAEKAKFKEYVEKQKEKKAHNKYFDSINRSYKKLTERLLTNTADKNIPEQYKKELAKVLAAFDLQTVGSKKYEARTGRQGKKSIKMANLKVTLGNIENKSGEFHVSDAVTDIIDELLGKNVGNGSNRSIEGLTIDELNSSELARIDKLLKALIHEFNTYKTVKINTKRQQVKDIGNAQVKSALEHAKVFGSGQDYYGVHGWVDRILNMDELTPAYLFRRIDPNKEGMALMYEQLEDSHDRYIRNTVQLSEWIDEIVGEYHHKGLLKKDAGVLGQWRSENYAQDFKLENGHTITLTPAQMMSVYCLSKRAQAYNHMTGAGIVVAPVSYNAKILSDLKKRAKVALPEMLTDADIKNIVSKLDPDQVKVANKLQNLMADKMAAWGNEASMNVLGIELFGEPDYFPIKSDKAGLISDLSEDQFVEAIRSFGFTKAVQPGARNAIMVEDIFDVIAQHCNNMNLYNAYSEAINDFMKVYNYRDVSEEGEYTVKQAIGHAYSQKATNFIMSFMKDLNGNVSNGRTTGINDAFNESLARAKKASVFANIRVAAQQPTAIGRAFAVISPKYASAMLKPDKAILDEMFEHCPIAKWKSLGYYDINMGRNIEDVIMNNNNVIEEAATWAYGALDNLTWGGIWQMVKAETEDKHPKVEKGSDEYWDLCNRRMREVVAFTQVVDSPFHRSHAMRSKNFMDKLATAFGAEPTLTYNMVRDGYIRAKEMVLTGDKVGATKVFGRTMSVFVFTAGLTAASAAFADVLRGKNPDGDDDDEITLLQQWWANTLANWKDNVNLLNNIYYVKDIMSLLDGWQINNLAFQGWKYIGTGIQQLYGNPFARSKDPWWKNMMYGVGYLTGVPVKTVMTDFGAIFNKAKNKLGFETPILDAYLESLSEIAIEKDEPKAEGSMWSLIKENTVDKAAEKMGYKPIEQKEEPAGEGSTAKPEEKEGFLARIGVGKTAKEKEQERAEKERTDKIADIQKKTESLSGEEKDKKVWSYVTTYLKSQNGDKPLNEFIQEGDYSTVNDYRKMYEEAGGNTEYFDQRIFDTSKSAMKKTIVYDPTEEQIKAQDNIKGYLLTHGMDESELSEMVYKSDTAKDMKVAFRLNDKELMLETLEPLVRAGLTYDDLERLWENRNRMQISSYKGRYKDKLKSTGNFIWPTDGQITSYFGYRNAPTAGASSNHPAIDIGAPMGTDVVAADGGVVIYAGTNGGYGNSVGIKHDNGMVTYYNHLSAWNVKVGDTVAQGQQIANVGSTGISTGAHLDFKILDANGEPVDPLKYLASRS